MFDAAGCRNSLIFFEVDQFLIVKAKNVASHIAQKWQKYVWAISAIAGNSALLLSRKSFSDFWWHASQQLKGWLVFCFPSIF